MSHDATLWEHPVYYIVADEAGTLCAFKSAATGCVMRFSEAHIAGSKAYGTRVRFRAIDEQNRTVEPYERLGVLKQEPGEDQFKEVATSDQSEVGRE